MFPCLAITSDDISVPFHPVSSSNLGLPAAANLMQNHPCILVSCESGGASLTSTPKLRGSRGHKGTTGTQGPSPGNTSMSPGGIKQVDPNTVPRR
jgi:hypothetical protein